MEQNTLKISNTIVWVAAYLGIMLFYTFLDVAVWRKIFPDFSEWINIIVIMICAFGFIWLLKKQYKIDMLFNITPQGIFWAVLCSVLFFLLLDKCLDPIFESAFPQSEQSYQETIQSLINSPITSLVQVCIIAPIYRRNLNERFCFGRIEKYIWSYWGFIIFLFAFCHPAL